MTVGCCDWLRRMIGFAGEQGFAVVAFRDGDYRRFDLQVRCMSREQMLKWERELAVPDAALFRLFERSDGTLEALAAVQRLPLQYCPHCRADLKMWIAVNTASFDRLAEEHHSLADE